MQESVSCSGTPSERPSRMTSDLCSDSSGASIVIGVASPIDSARASTVEECRCGIGEWISGERTNQDPIDAVACHVDRRLREQDDVAALDVDILVRRVVPGRDSPDRPVGFGVDVAHVHLQRYQRQNPAGIRWFVQQPPGGRELIAFPGKAGIHVNRRDRR